MATEATSADALESRGHVVGGVPGMVGCQFLCRLHLKQKPFSLSLSLSLSISLCLLLHHHLHLPLLRRLLSFTLINVSTVVHFNCDHSHSERPQLCRFCRDRHHVGRRPINRRRLCPHSLKAKANKADRD
jgi:hypothetical protein